jgi:hypothetical protein
MIKLVNSKKGSRAKFTAVEIEITIKEKLSSQNRGWDVFIYFPHSTVYSAVTFYFLLLSPSLKTP